jgi:tRNA modification GTPase
VLLVLDGSEALTGEDLSLLDDTRGRQRLVVVNKRDLPSQIRLPAGIGDEVVPLSALRGEGVDELRRELARTLLGSDRSETAGISNIRHIESLTRSRDALARAIAAVDDALGQLPEEFLLSELAEVRQALEEITGKRTTDELLEEIFSRFCVGK